MEACSAACAAPGRSTPPAASRSACGPETVHHIARVRSVRGGKSSGVSPSIRPSSARRRTKEVTCRVTSTSPKQTWASPQRISRCWPITSISVTCRAEVT